MLEPIRNVMSGYNATLFVYGMTGAGKTHTMFNSAKEVEHKGLVDLTLTRIFE
jgi:Cdc6-like AAA superfamily ATPase